MQEPEAQRLAALAGDHFKQAEAAGLDNPLQREFARAGEDYASSEPARRREALERCRRVTKEHGEKRGLEDLYWLMGFMTQKEESIDSCNAALRINSWHVMALFTRGLRAQAIGKPKEAMEDYTRAIEMHPRFKNAFLVRGKIHADAGEESPARQDYDRAIEIDPNYFTAYSNRSKLSYDFSKNDEAILDATKAIELSPGYASAYLNRGTARGGRGEWDLALEDFQKGMKLDDRPDFLWEFNLGNATFMKGAFAEARRHYQNAVQLNARHVRTWYYLSCALSSEGDPKGAADALEQAIRLSLASVLKENPQQDPRLEGLRASPEWNRVRRLLAGEK